MDWDEDGDQDLLVGARDGYITYFENIGTAGNSVLTNRGQLKNGSGFLYVTNNAIPCVVDWNGDGKKDLLVGTENYEVLLYLNTGTNSSPAFSGYSVVVRKAIWSDLGIMRNHPQVGDLDGDGIFDLIVGEEWGTVHFFKNIGTNANPLFGSSEQLKLANGNKIQVVDRAHVEVVDWDEDGNLDLLVGAGDGAVYFFRALHDDTAAHDPASSVPRNFFLDSNFPNPFNPGTTITYGVPIPSIVRLHVCDLSGREVAVLVNEEKPAGRYQVTWNATGMASGVYLYRLQAGEFVETKKLILVK